MSMPERVGRARLAVLIDAENASRRRARAVPVAADRSGEAKVRRICGDLSNGRLAWRHAAIRSRSIAPCRERTHVRGEDAVDIAFAVDAMDPMRCERPDGIAPMASDSGFTRRLREDGLAACGFGESKTQQASCVSHRRFVAMRKMRNGACGAARNSIGRP